MVKKRVFIIHGWGGKPDAGWLAWISKELSLKGFEVKAPIMPDSENPKIESWVSFLEKNIKNPDKNTFFIGHSIGCQTILRYLERLPKTSKIGGVFFVAGWFNLTEDTWDEDYTPEIAKEWIETSIDFNKIKKCTNNFVGIFSDNDPYVNLIDGDLFKQRLNTKNIILHKKGHISGEDGVKEFPILLNELLEMTK